MFPLLLYPLKLYIYFRLELAKVLHILKLIKANKHREKPYISMAEIIVADLMTKAGIQNPEVCIEERQHSGEVNCDGLVIKGTFSLTKADLNNEKKKKSSEINITHQQCINNHTTNDKFSSNNSFSKARMLRNSHLKHIGKSNSSPFKDVGTLQVVGNSQKSRDNPPVVAPARPPSRQRNSYSEFESLQEGSEILTLNLKQDPPANHSSTEPLKRKNGLNKTNKSPTDPTNESMEFIDIECDIDNELMGLGLNSPNSGPKAHSGNSVKKLEDLSIKDAVNLREIIFGNATGISFNPEWEKQSFTFNDTTDLEFGLVQHKGGPCGILAAVQALIIKALLENKKGNFSPSNAERQEVLAKVLSSVLWHAANYEGGSKCVKVCYDSGRSRFQSAIMYRNDGITEKVQLCRCDSLTATENCVLEFLPQFQSPMGKGCILFLYSVILSRGKITQLSIWFIKRGTRIISI